MPATYPDARGRLTAASGAGMLTAGDLEAIPGPRARDHLEVAGFRSADPA